MRKEREIGWMKQEYVLGWDAAWTPQGSGAWCVARGGELLVHEPCLKGEALLKALRKLLETYAPRLAAVDFPLAVSGVRGWREADLQTTRAFSRYRCPVHSPSPRMPGIWGEEVMQVFLDHGYSLGTAAGLPDKAVVEVYPHTVLLWKYRLLERYPYKVGRAAKYWPETPPAERKKRLLLIYRQMWQDLGGGAFPELGQAPTLARLKTLEDLLDALLCREAAQGILAGDFAAYGDTDAAIWNPKADRLRPLPAARKHPA